MRGGLDAEQLWQVGAWATGGLEPDLTLVLDLAPEEAAARRDRPADRIEGRPPDYHVRVREGFLAEARRRPERVRVIDARPAPLVVQENIRRTVSDFLHLD